MLLESLEIKGDKMAITVYLLAAGEQLTEFGVQSAVTTGRIFARRRIRFNTAIFAGGLPVIETAGHVLHCQGESSVPVRTLTSLRDGFTAKFVITQAILKPGVERVLVVTDAEIAFKVCQAFDKSWAQRFDLCAVARISFGTSLSDPHIDYDGILS